MKRQNSYSMACVLTLGVSLLFFEPADAQDLTAQLPDLRTVIPLHLQIMNKQQREILRFSNGVANTGAGPWQMRPRFPISDTLQTQDAIQEILDSHGNVVEEKVVSQFEFHQEHNHWPINGIALFEVRQGSPDDPVFGSNSIKTIPATILVKRSCNEKTRYLS